MLANRKAKKLKSLLQHQQALRHSRVPYIEPIVFLSAPELRCQLSGTALHGVYLRHDAQQANAPDIIAVLQGTTETAARGERASAPPIDRRLSQAVARAMEQAGIRPSQRARCVGDYTLERLLAESDVYQDWEATHVRFANVKRRVRLYPHARQATEASRTMQRQAAEREYLVLEGIHHAGILKAESFTEHERGPALIFEHDPAAERLDLFLRERGDTLDISGRLALMRQIAETLQYAHEHRLYHRALSPQTILVMAPTSSQPRIKIFDWQTARRGTTSTGGTGYSTDGGMHLALFGDQQSLLYMAPEAIAGTAFDAAKLDIFALGTVAYHVFSGRPPATSIEELHQKCYNGRGLHISEVMDGAGEELQELIQSSTCPNVEDRLESVEAFLEVLGRVEAELTTPALEEIVHPLEARPNDRLEGGFVVKRRLGQGSTSVALLVERHGREGVLKVALEPALNARLEEEGDILRQLRHPNIVELYEQTQVSGHAALFMAVAGVDSKAGAYTLAQRLRAEGRLSLDLLQRFGEELLVVTDWLEQHGISHRDIKPDNIGIGQTPSGRLTLILFDFSLANTPVDNIRAGTPPYLDPFLRRRQPPRWDLHAERFAVAMTLYEMATGTLPIWGDGASDPAMLDCEVSLDSALFDPAVRDELTAFFSKALHSDYRRRFDHAEDMLRSWRRIFASVDRPATETDHGAAVDFDDALASATEDTPLSGLGLSPRLLDALMRIGAQTVGELLRLPRIRLYRNQGLGQKIVKDICNLAERIAQHFAERGDQSSTLVTEEPESDEARADPRRLSVDLLSRRVLPRRLDVEDRRILTALLGLDSNGRRDAWPAQQDVAARLGVEPTVVQDVVQRARAYWGKQGWMTALRDDIAAILDKHGGVATAEELTGAVLAARGSTAEAPQRSRRAAAVAYAALETEMARESARYLLYRGQGRVFAVATPSLADYYTGSPTARAQYAERLGLKADELAAADPLLTPTRVVDELQAVSPPPSDPTLPADRLLRLAVAASKTAALSSRLEVYPRRMPAARALKLGIGSLLGPKSLTAQQVRQRIASRYPEAESLPDPPALDDLLRDAGLDWVWDSSVAAGQGGYRPRSVTSDTSSGTSSSRPWQPPDELSTSPEMEAAHALEARLAKAVAEHGFLVLTVAPRHLPHAERELLRRFPLTRIHLEALLIQAMKATAEALGADWTVVLKADAAPRESADWRRLQILVRRSMPAVEAALFAASGPVLLVYPGLLARYDHIQLLERLRDACLQGHGAPGFLVLVAADEQHQLPVLDGKPVPVIHTSEWARISEAWLNHAHGAGKIEV